ncbi:acyl-CoA dehydrogenase family protein [Tessaracoccus sp. MC1865]|uniref:acyl-CoA dehydrogenase family protein n=1 Tax=Tessaracoccus sp. MC1865 TaxID=2760310 RepID=UPI001600ECC7|nr:acyl-CoA dehydrogenase [Tessaracoccus sp. MC1865]MBB1483948.1 acyl-CoA dehydrogenase family protein [Tessaracoccus sp. MC1865]QTO36996.1 acyl-CoA dehydrogenase family protein [Tessaracoccus sp. MC1865]
MTITPTGEGLRRALDGPFHALKQRWRNEVSADDVVRDTDLSIEEAREWTLDRLKRLTQREFVTAGFPAAQGGTGTSAESVANFEMMAMGDLSLTIKSGVQHGLFGGAITNLGTQWHHETFLPGAIDASLPGCFAMTELGHGSDVQSIETSITWDAETGELVVHSPSPTAAKAYIGNAARDGRMAAVFGQLWVNDVHHGVHVALVPIRDEQGDPMPGVTIGDHGHKGGLLGVDNGTIAFEHVRVPRRMLLDRYGGVDENGEYYSPIASQNARFFTMLGTLVRGRICVGGGAASATRKALSIAVRYANGRRQFRQPGLGEEILLMDYLQHQRRLLPDVARAYAYGFAQNEVSLQLQRIMEADGSDPQSARELETRAAGMKAVLTRWANDTLQECREASGGAGYMSDNGITLARQDADIFATFEGDNTVLLQLVAKALLLDYKSTWGDMDLAGTAQKTAKLLGGRFLERTTARSAIDRLVATAKRKPEAEQLRARGWHVEMFEYRERHMVEGLAQRMRAAGRAKSFDAINACQPHMIEAAKAHVDRVVLEAFIAGIEECGDDYVKALLIKVCDLYALATIETNRAWFLEHEVFDARRSKTITSTVDALCGELRPQSLALAEGLGVPEEWLVHPRRAVPPMMQAEAPVAEAEELRKVS